jgi:hypothetical protein
MPQGGYSSPYNFRLNQTPAMPGAGPQDFITQGKAAEAELYGGQAQYEMPAAPSELEQIDGITEDAYKKWGDLKSFAQTMWQNYKIDVSRPDMRNQMSVKAHQAYKKGLADVQYTLDTLKEGRKTQVADQQAMRLGQVTMNQDRPEGPSNTIAPEQRMTNTQLHPMVSELNNQFQREFYTDKEYSQAMTQYLGAKRQLQQYAQQDPGNAEYWGRQESSLTPPIRSTKLFPPMSPTAAAALNPTPVVDELNQIRDLMVNGDSAGAARILGGDVSRIATVRGADGTTKFRVYTKDGSEPIEIDLHGQYGGLDVINELRNRNLPADQKLPTRMLMNNKTILEQTQDPTFAVPLDDTHAANIQYLIQGSKLWSRDPEDASSIVVKGEDGKEFKITNPQQVQRDVKKALITASKGGKLFMPNSVDKVKNFSIDEDGVVTIEGGKYNTMEGAYQDTIKFNLEDASEAAAYEDWLSENSAALFAKAPKKLKDKIANATEVEGMETKKSDPRKATNTQKVTADASAPLDPNIQKYIEEALKKKNASTR